MTFVMRSRIAIEKGDILGRSTFLSYCIRPYSIHVMSCNTHDSIGDY